VEHVIQNLFIDWLWKVVYSHNLIVNLNKLIDYGLDLLNYANVSEVSVDAVRYVYVGDQQFSEELVDPLPQTRILIEFFL
jgi:hypothetical protein